MSNSLAALLAIMPHVRSMHITTEIDVAAVRNDPTLASALAQLRGQGEVIIEPTVKTTAAPPPRKRRRRKAQIAQPSTFPRVHDVTEVDDIKMELASFKKGEKRIYVRPTNMRYRTFANRFSGQGTFFKKQNRLYKLKKQEGGGSLMMTRVQ